MIRVNSTSRFLVDKLSRRSKNPEFKTKSWIPWIVSSSFFCQLFYTGAVAFPLNNIICCLNSCQFLYNFTQVCSHIQILICCLTKLMDAITIIRFLLLLLLLHLFLLSHCTFFFSHIIMIITQK